MVPDPVLIRIGPIAIYWYGALIVGGAVLAAHIASRLSRRNGHDPEMAWNLLLIVLFTGVVGARLYHIVSSWDYYRQYPGQMFGLQMSGFGIFGAVAGGLIGVWVFARYHKLRFLEWADYCAPGLILAQAIGRWGNFFNMELFGPPTDLPWGIYIPPERRVGPGLPAEFAMYERFHPTFFYESALNLIGFVLLYMLARRWSKGRLYGDLILLYGVIYAVIRFFIEFLRPDAWVIAGIPTAQWVSVGMLVAAVATLLLRRRFRRPEMEYRPGPEWVPLGPSEELPDGSPPQP
jgi:phosphatidylglycerol---prolipoprotein diacylglyceryl transferase